MKKLTFAAALAAVIAATAPAARAETASVAVLTETIPFYRSSLATPDGARALLHRIEVTAKRLCAPEPSMLIRGRLPEINACRARSVAAAVAEVDAPLLTAALNRRTAVLAAR